MRRNIGGAGEADGQRIIAEDVRKPFFDTGGQRAASPQPQAVDRRLAGVFAPRSVALVGFLMFGNLIRECGVLGTLSDSAQNQLANLVTLLLGISVAFRMQAEAFITFETMAILALGLIGFVFDTVGGVLFAKLLNLFSRKKVNPMIGAAGISAFPMASRVVHKMGREEDPYNYLLMHAAGAKVSGQIASVIAGGLVITLVEGLI